MFCFTPKGQLIQLPRGATPVDFAYAVHSQVGDACVGAKINGRLLPLRHQLQNGDQVEIMTARGGTPSPQWERFVVTGKARARIRRFIHQQQRQQHLDAGRAELAKAFRQAGRGRLGEGAGAGAEDAEVRRGGRSLHRGRQRQCRPEGCGARRLSGAAPVAACAAHGSRRRRRGRTAGTRTSRISTCRSPAWCQAWRITSPAAAIRCRATRSSASSQPARA